MQLLTPVADSSEGLSLIDRYVADQQRLTAVEHFAEKHERHQIPSDHRYYRDLIPLVQPREGQQYAFEVDLDACTGCKSCVTACHSLNDLDEDETWRKVGLLVGGPAELPVLQHVTTACHHCIEPACLEGCPVLAYEKDPVTGIVRHLDDQCIGCQYCIFKCPYDVPRYNPKRGIIRKCDMCSDRLAVGEATACVQACPNHAIRITIVDKQKVIEDYEANVFLPDAPEPDYTLPTTNYKTARPLPRNMLAGDHYHAAPQHAHAPLVIMLVLTQLSVGAFLVGRFIESLWGHQPLISLQPLHSAMSLVLGLLALGASVLHLGRPLYAYRAVLNLKTSWLSREIVVFGIFALLAAVYAGCSWFARSTGESLVTTLGTAVVLSGLFGIFCSVMVYHDTRRECWALRWTGTKFFLTTLVLGLSTTLLCGSIGIAASNSLEVQQSFRDWGGMLCRSLVVLSLIKLTYEGMVFTHLRYRKPTALKRTAMLMLRPLRWWTAARFITGFVGGVLLPAILAHAVVQERASMHAALYVAVALIFLLTLAGEFFERYLFFTAAVAPKMPGGLGE